jgi:hypothetical protein
MDSCENYQNIQTPLKILEPFAICQYVSAKVYTYGPRIPRKGVSASHRKKKNVPVLTEIEGKQRLKAHPPTLTLLVLHLFGTSFF